MEGLSEAVDLENGVLSGDKNSDSGVITEGDSEQSNNKAGISKEVLLLKFIIDNKVFLREDMRCRHYLTCRILFIQQSHLIMISSNVLHKNRLLIFLLNRKFIQNPKIMEIILLDCIVFITTPVSFPLISIKQTALLPYLLKLM